MQANGPAYQVPTGRRDGFVSNVSLADDMPDVGDSIQLLKTKFFNKGLTVKDLVLLSGIFLHSLTHILHIHASLSCRIGDIMVVEEVK